MFRKAGCLDGYIVDHCRLPRKGPPLWNEPLIPEPRLTASTANFRLRQYAISLLTTRHQPHRPLFLVPRGHDPMPPQGVRCETVAPSPPPGVARQRLEPGRALTLVESSQVDHRPGPHSLGPKAPHASPPRRRTPNTPLSELQNGRHVALSPPCSWPSSCWPPFVWPISPLQVTPRPV